MSFGPYLFSVWKAPSCKVRPWPPHRGLEGADDHVGEDHRSEKTYITKLSSTIISALSTQATLASRPSPCSCEGIGGKTELAISADRSADKEQEVMKGKAGASYQKLFLCWKHMDMYELTQGKSSNMPPAVSKQSVTSTSSWGLHADLRLFNDPTDGPTYQAVWLQQSQHRRRCHVGYRKEKANFRNS